MLAAPLIAGNDLRKMDRETIDVLTNKEIISINQDPLGIQGFRYAVKDSVEIWLKPLQDGAWAVAFLNRNLRKTVSMKFDWKENVVKDTLSGRVLGGEEYTITDCWTHASRGTSRTPLTLKIEPHDIVVLKLVEMK
jgi:alpha-galactosidase